ncbi:MAG TPA: LapA family protein [Allocoleopsis sp.]
MKTIANLLTSLVLAAWIGAIAILSIQNIMPVSVRFLNYETIQIPIGIVLAFSVGIGAIVGSLAPVVWRLTGGQRERYDDDY